MNSTDYHDIQFLPTLPSECKVACIHDTICSYAEGYENLQVCVHPTLLNKPLSTIVGVTENVLMKDDLPSRELPSGASLKFLVFLLIVLLIFILGLLVYGFWDRHQRRKNRGRTILKNESTGLRLDLITNTPIDQPANEERI